MPPILYCNDLKLPGYDHMMCLWYTWNSQLLISLPTDLDIYIHKAISNNKCKYKYISMVYVYLFCLQVCFPQLLIFHTNFEKTN